MAHTSTRLNDFTHPLKAVGGLHTLVKRALLNTLRSMFGKTVLSTNGTTTVNASVTPTAIAGLTFRVKKNKTYRVAGRIYVSTGATPGALAGLSLSGSAAATGNIVYTYFAATTMGSQVVTANPLGSASAGIAGAVTEIDIDGYFVPDVSGYVNVTFAQSVSNASNTIAQLGSHVAVTRVQG
jgi:hypothetical protein